MKRILSGHESLPGLRVMPVVRGRLNFAGAALEAIAAENPDFLAIDLPGFLNGGDWFETVLSRLPLATSVLVIGAAGSLVLPFTPSDACTMAAWQARRTGLPFTCVDNLALLSGPGDRMAGPNSGLATDPVLPHNLETYFAPAWAGVRSECSGLTCVRTTLTRASGIGRELQTICNEHRRVLFIADFRTWWAVRKCLDRPLRVSPRPVRHEEHAALVFEDALALWHAGLAEMPHLVHEFFRSADHGPAFDVEAVLQQVLGAYAPLAAHLPLFERTTAALFDAIEEQAGNSAAAEVAARLLDYPAPGCQDAADRIPSFGTITDSSVLPRYWVFDPPDVFDASPYYKPSPGEITAFFPGREQVCRAGWGPGALPYVTRSEALRIAPSLDTRWSVDANSNRIAEASALLRQHLGGLDVQPPLATVPDLFTPVVFIWTNESDGDVRTVEDSNLTRRRMQFEQLSDAERAAENCPQPDLIHTLCATRSLNAPWLPPLVQYDIASSIATLYSGPEAGPKRYDAVLHHNPPERICRLDPSCDSDLEAFSGDQIAAAFAVKWAQDLVIVASHDEWQPSPPLLEFAAGRNVRIVTLPIALIPRTLSVRLRRRVFVDKQIRMNGTAGRRLENRFANWRLQPAG